jgi:hypothetical protein
MWKRLTRAAVFLAAGAALASAQVEMSGVWTPLFHEDQPERIPGPELADFVGLPINEAARQWALSWDASRFTLQEHQCQVHTAAYMYRGPLLLRIWEERDPQTHEVIAIRHYISNYEQNRTIYMDGRPHPPEFAPHTWMGFSTGKWEGDIRTVTTTHIKQGWHRRNGVPSSDQITLTEHFILHGNRLSHVTIVTDPVYLTEPLIKSHEFVRSDNPAGGGAGIGSNWLYPCEYVVEIADRPRGEVPSYPPGENPALNDFAKRHGIPLPAAMGGAETMYPEYRRRLGENPGRSQ